MTAEPSTYKKLLTNTLEEKAEEKKDELSTQAQTAAKSILPSSGEMFSKLVFIIDDEEVEFDACEIICIAHQIVMEKLAGLHSVGVDLPDHATVDKTLDQKFWQFTHVLANVLEGIYGVKEESINEFLVGAYVNPLNILRHLSLLGHIKTKEKISFVEIPIDEHIAIPMQLIQMTTMEQWLFIAKYLADNHLQEESIAGWWFRVGGRVIRLRNDVENGKLIENNKQFYASDHDFEINIRRNTKREIKRCINNFSWGEGDRGNYYSAFKFWQYFILSDLKGNEIEFIERITDDILKSDKDCQQLFLSLEHPTRKLPPQPLPIPHHLSDEVQALRRNIFRGTFMRYVRRSGYVEIETSAKEWVEIKFITDITDEIAASQKACDKLLADCLYSYFRPDVPVHYEHLPDTTKRVRKRKFDQLFKFYLERHQSCLRKEFIARLNDSIAESPQECQLLLLSLAHPSPKLRGTIDENSRSAAGSLNFGMRDRVDNPELSYENRKDLSEDQILIYGAIFDDLIKQFNYVTCTILQQRVEFFKLARNPFHTQIRQVMHEDDADNYVMAHVLHELAKKINHGKHEPLFPELGAYGDRDVGDSYQKFERSLSEYLRKPGALSESALAAKMRAILGGSSIETKDLAFLPCLTAAWFISESARNPLTTMTSLMLLDMLENEVVLHTCNGENWYAWRNVLIHPQKGTNIGRVRDLYGNKINIDEFGSCHPMVHQGSVTQTKKPPSLIDPLNIARQKEGSLIIHWLQLVIDGMSEENKHKHKVRKIIAKSMQDLGKENLARDGNSSEAIDEEKLLYEKSTKEKKLNKTEGTVRVKRSKDENADVSKQEREIAKLKEEIRKLDNRLNPLHRKNAIKKQIRIGMIEPLLKLRLSSLKNLLKPSRNVSLALFQEAVLAGNLELLNSLLTRDDIDLNTPDADGDTLLILAARKGHVAIVARLLARCANINHQNNLGNTALHYAAVNTHIAVVDMLLNNPEINIDQKNNQGYSPYDCVRGESKYRKVAKRFHFYYERERQRKSPETKAKLLHDLAKSKNPIVLKRINTLVKRGADIFWRNAEGLTASEVAQKEGNERIFCFLRNKEFELIENAIKTDDLQALRRLLKNGAQSNILSTAGVSIADVAMTYHNQTAFYFIRTLGLNRQEESSTGNFCLSSPHYSLFDYEYTNQDIVNLLTVNLGAEWVRINIAPENLGNPIYYTMFCNLDRKQIILPPVTCLHERTMAESLIDMWINAQHHLGDTQEILIPFNPGGHWVLLRIDLAGHTLVYLDSLDHKNDGSVQEAASSRIDGFKEYLNSLGGEIEFTRCFATARIQPDDRACGVMTVDNTLDIANGQPPPNVFLSPLAVLKRRLQHRQMLHDQSLSLEEELQPAVSSTVDGIFTTPGLSESLLSETSRSTIAPGSAAAVGAGIAQIAATVSRSSETLDSSNSSRPH